MSKASFQSLCAALRRSFAVVLFVAVTTTPVTAQARFVTTTLGPSDEFDPIYGNSIDPRQNISQRFEYLGPDGYAVSSLRLALLRGPFGVSYNVNLWSGQSMGTASLLERWSVDAVPLAPGVFQTFELFTMQSLTGSRLAASGTYWISVDSPTPFGGGWAQNSQGIVGVYAYILNPRPGWREVTDISMAFEVTALDTVVPEPESLGLLFFGLLALWPLRLLSRIRSR